MIRQIVFYRHMDTYKIQISCTNNVMNSGEPLIGLNWNLKHSLSFHFVDIRYEKVSQTSTWNTIRTRKTKLLCWFLNNIVSAMFSLIIYCSIIYLARYLLWLQQVRFPCSGFGIREELENQVREEIAHYS